MTKCAGNLESAFARLKKTKIEINYSISRPGRNQARFSYENWVLSNELIKVELPP